MQLVPADSPQSFDRIKMSIPCRQCEIMDEAGGRDPAIVLRNQGTHFRKPRLHHAVALGNLVVQMHGLREREKGADALELLFPVFRMIGSIEKLAHDRDGQVEPGVFLDSGTDFNIATQMGADDIGIQRESVHGSMRSQPSSMTRSKASASAAVMHPKDASKAACLSDAAVSRI